MSNITLRPGDDRGAAQCLRDAADAIDRGDSIAVLLLDLRPGGYGAGSAKLLVQGDGVDVLDLLAGVDVVKEKTLDNLQQGKPI